MLLLLIQALAAANECPDDDLDTDVGWVGSGSVSILRAGDFELV